MAVRQGTTPFRRPSVRKGLILWPTLAAMAILLGIGIALQPIIAAMAVLGGMILLYGLLAGELADRTFLASLAIILGAYAAFDRGVAYVGFGGVYIGEAVLALSIIPTVRMLVRRGIGPIEAALIVFMIWGALRTVPYLGTYGIDAIRDGVTWGYGIFALAVSLVLTPGAVRKLLDWYRPWMYFFLLWVPVAWVLVEFAIQYVPAWPGAKVPIVYIKHGDIAVHLAVVAAFMLSGLYDRRPASVPGWAVWTVWMVDVALVGSISRGGLLAVVIGAGSGLLFIRSSKRLIQVLALGLTFLAVLYLVNPTVPTGYQGRTVSFNQLINNVVSVAGGEDTDSGGLAGNREWRLSWWRKIVDYSTRGQYAPLGKGFGVNLANEDGFAVDEEGALRSPHSAHMTMLARGGPPMLLLWAIVNLVFVYQVIQAARVARRVRPLLAQLLACDFVLWLAAFINMSFDVYLEGPQGGIWFWASIGFGAWLVRAVREGVDLDDATDTGEREPPRRATRSVRNVPDPTRLRPGYSAASSRR